jgi:trehalose 6-phosphate synthase/phosphatase
MSNERGRLIIVSNRLPVSVERKPGEFEYRSSVGGLATSLNSLRKRMDMLWLGWPGVNVSHEKDREEISHRLSEELSCIPLFLPRAQFDRYYFGFSNGCIWPLFHYFPQHAHYEVKEWQAYRQINRAFKDKLLEITRPGDRIWIHDYHLMALPQMVREELPDASIGFFLHIPFPSSEIFRNLPWRDEILRGLLGADLIGFHTFNYARHYLSSLLRLLGMDHEFGQVLVGGRPVKVDTFPLGVDLERFSKALKTKVVKQRLGELEKETQGRKIILSVDRLDFTKGIPERLRAYELFLEKYPEWHDKVSMIALCVPSRTSVPEYRDLKREVDELVGRINGRFGSPGWTPIWYMYRFLAFERLVPLYQHADVALVTPLRDGMNLVAKEFLACHPEGAGVLVLSETAGASEELGEALIVNPHDEGEMAEALYQALQISPERQVQSNATMLARLKRYDTARWADDFLSQLEALSAEQVTPQPIRFTHAWSKRITKDYAKAASRLFLLDYDGTLIHFFPRPGDAKPDSELLELLGKLAKDKHNNVVVISGRDSQTLETWLGDLGTDLVAEHGAQVKYSDGEDWIHTERDSSLEWKDQIRPVLEVFMDRTPGAAVEEKSAALVWHYRKADPGLGSLRAKELTDTLEAFVANTPLHILQGNKVVEIKRSNTTKSAAARLWLDRDQTYDFVLAIGDDVTDEEMFSSLPEDSWRIRVGYARHSNARYFIPSPNEVRALLKHLVDGSDE